MFVSGFSPNHDLKCNPVNMKTCESFSVIPPEK